MSVERDPWSIQSRGELKLLGALLDRPEGQAQRALWAAKAQAAGVELPEDWEQLPGKRLIKLLLDRSSEAQVRKNPIVIDESFSCAHCQLSVPKGGRLPRDHCPLCLWSLHVDGPVPGDRAANCGGELEAVSADIESGVIRITYRCVRCGFRRRNRALDDDAAPLLRALVAKR